MYRSSEGLQLDQQGAATRAPCGFFLPADLASISDGTPPSSNVVMGSMAPQWGAGLTADERQGHSQELSFARLSLAPGVDPGQMQLFQGVQAHEVNNTVNLLDLQQAANERRQQLNANGAQGLGDTTLYLSHHEGTELASIAELDGWGLPGWYSAPGVLVHSMDSSPSGLTASNEGLVLIQQLEHHHAPQQLHQLDLQHLQQQQLHEHLQQQQLHEHLQQQQHLQEQLHQQQQQIKEQQQHIQEQLKALQGPQGTQVQLLPLEGLQGLQAMSNSNTGQQVWLTSGGQQQQPQQQQQLPSASIAGSTSNLGISSRVQVERLLASMAMNRKPGLSSNSQVNTAQMAPVSTTAQLSNHILGNQLVTTMIQNNTPIVTQQGNLALGQVMTPLNTAQLMATNQGQHNQMVPGVVRSTMPNLARMPAAPLTSPSQPALAANLGLRQAANVARYPLSGPTNQQRYIGTTVRAQPPSWAGADWNPRAAVPAHSSTSGTGVFLPQLRPTSNSSGISQSSTPSLTSRTSQSLQQQMGQPGLHVSGSGVPSGSISAMGGSASQLPSASLTDHQRAQSGLVHGDLTGSRPSSGTPFTTATPAPTATERKE